MATMRHHDPVLNIHGPGPLLANVPALLGFYPSESIVILAFNRLGETRYELGHVLRFDLSDTQLATQDPMLIDALDGHDSLFAFVISARSTQSESALDVCDRLARATATHLVGVWHTAEIMTGESYRALSNTMPSDHPDWLTGVISDVATSLAMGPVVEAGDVPEICRQDAVDSISLENPNVDIDHLSTIIPMSSEVEALADFEQALATCTDRTVEEVLRDGGVLHKAAQVLKNVHTRDAAMLGVIDNPKAGAVLLRALARSLRGEPRANALALYSVAELAQHRTARAQMALRVSLQEFSKHQLTLLLWQSQQIPDKQQIVSALRDGALSAYYALGGDVEHCA